MLRLSEVRYELAEARGYLRDAQDALKLAQAQAEQRAIDAANGPKGIGSNKEDRERALTIALGEDADYGQALSRVRLTEDRIDHLEAELREHEDQRKAAEWAIRAKLADGLFGKTDAPSYADGAIFDDAAQIRVDGRLTRLADDLPF